jgi:hypothetical protein
MYPGAAGTYRRAAGMYPGRPARIGGRGATMITKDLPLIEGESFVK